MVYKSVDHEKLWSICFLQQHLFFYEKPKLNIPFLSQAITKRVLLLGVVHNELALLSSWFLGPYNVERETSTRSFFYVCCVYSLLFFC